LAESKVIHLPVFHSISLWAKVSLGWTKKVVTSPWRGLLARLWFSRCLFYFDDVNIEIFGNFNHHTPDIGLRDNTKSV
jgi:hypothetical protein